MTDRSWPTEKLGRTARIGNGSTPRRDSTIYWGSGDVPWLNSSVVNESRVTRADQFVTAVALRECHLPVVAPGSVLVGLTGQGKTRGMATILDIEATLNQHIAYVTPDPSRWFSEYLLWSLRAAYDELRCLSEENGSTKGGLTCEALKQFRLIVPPIGYQRAIADYLNRETARIDTLIEEQRRLIEMLRDRRGAVISNAVARGLDETVALKDSGLPGAGPVPAHWEVMPLRYTISFQEGPGIMAADFRDDGVPLLRVSSVRTARSTLEGCNYLDPDEVDRRWSHFRVDLGDLLISASASMGTVSEVTEETTGSVPYTGIIRIKPGCMHKDFIRWFVVSDEFMGQVDSLKTGSTIQHFGPTHLAQMRVALPPIDQQLRIAAYLDEQVAKIDRLIAETERFIELARERRSALIAAAVTGQIDVHETA